MVLRTSSRSHHSTEMPNATNHCPLSGGRALYSTLPLRPSPHCARPVLEDVAAASLAVVVTYSSGSLAAQRGFPQLQQLGSLLLDRFDRSSVRALTVGKGSRCEASNVPLARWQRAGVAHCIEGPNVGARESHTIWAFCSDFYRHLPRATLFVQDDPALHAIRRDLRPPGGVPRGRNEELDVEDLRGTRKTATCIFPWP